MRYALPVLAAFFLLAFGAGFLATRPLTPAKARPTVYADSSVKANHDDGWRRTADGWERASSWEQPAISASTDAVQKVHPLVGAALVALLSIGALLAHHHWRSDNLDARIAKFITPLRSAGR